MPQRRRERNVQKPVVKYARSLGFKAVKQDVRGERGIPDYAFYGRPRWTFWIEFKREGEEPEPIQLWYHKQLRALGFRVYVVDDVEAGRKIIDFEYEAAKLARSRKARL